MRKRSYRTVKDYRAACEQKDKTIHILKESRESILYLSAKMPNYWQDSHGDALKMELVREIEQLIGELENESD